MKLKILLATTLLIPSLAFADSSFFSWITSLQVVPQIQDRAFRIIKKPVEVVANKVEQVVNVAAAVLANATSTATTTPAATTTPPTAPTTPPVATTTPVKPTATADDSLLTQQITKLKSDNVSLTKTIATLKQQLASLTNAQNSCLASVEQIKLQTSPDTLAKIKSLEWNISGAVDNNYRNVIDTDGNMGDEKVVNDNFFRDPNQNVSLRNAMSEYDKLVGANLSQMFQKFIDASAALEGDRFREFYNYFQSIRKFPK